jgi:hypothetical protein
MKKVIASLLIANSSASLAYLGTWNDPLKPFDATKNELGKMSITWKITNDVVGECNKMNKSMGFAKQLGPLTACSYWKSDTCVIITSKTPTMHEIGHEIRHCFQGNWH